MIHREGYVTLIIAFAIAVLISYLTCTFLGCPLCWIVHGIVWFLFLFLVSFFRNPKRTIPELNDQLVYAPADGKVVVIEEVSNEEYGGNGLQISIFMSPANVHVNRIPTAGTVAYERYHKGSYLPAWNPKSSSENERHTTIIQTTNGRILLKQIAGALARRICQYAKLDQVMKQGQEFGFIKFGSRVDIILPLNAIIKVALNQKVTGNKTVIAQFP